MSGANAWGNERVWSENHFSLISSKNHGGGGEATHNKKNVIIIRKTIFSCGLIHKGNFVTCNKISFVNEITTENFFPRELSLLVIEALKLFSVFGGDSRGNVRGTVKN